MFTNNVSSTSAGIAIGGCGPVDRSNPSHASTSMQGGQAVFENDNYRSHRWRCRRWSRKRCW